MDMADASPVAQARFEKMEAQLESLSKAIEVMQRVWQTKPSPQRTPGCRAIAASFPFSSPIPFDLGDEAPVLQSSIPIPGIPLSMPLAPMFTHVQPFVAASKFAMTNRARPQAARPQQQPMRPPPS
ncbi:hypothetical protein H6P81_021152 [Aristolochia fimbriata]|uniref:Uncharacterized protein n=1 Tax=Aristolochia fimbriata TaxID=158543 RepID=A0AAV7DRI7_ARIFI|nr:hypothetical protein H6P81_021152 [Aristolochia fimbriata]